LFEEEEKKETIDERKEECQKVGVFVVREKKRKKNVVLRRAPERGRTFEREGK
jgi:hypothetical protein